MAEYKDDNFLFESNNETQNEELAFLNKESKNQDGIYRPRLEDAAEPKGAGYKATIRFLRNLKRDGSGTGPAAIKKHVHYADFKDQPELAGFYDCEKNISDKTPCPLCLTHWKLFNSNNQSDKEKSKSIKRSTKFYSYVMIIEDEQHPELVGKIMVYPYGAQIQQKINAENNGDVGEKCNVFDFVTGKDFRLVIKMKKTPRLDGSPGTLEMPNYDTSQFLASSPIKIWNEKTGKFVTPPTTVNDNGKIAIVDKKWQDKIKEVVMTNRPSNVNLEDHAPSMEGWSDATRANVNKIIQILSGNDFVSADNSIRKASTKLPVVDILEEDNMKDLFDFDSDEDDSI